MSDELAPTALSIAGSDCSGGAGIQADLKTFEAHDIYGASVVTLLTAQNTQGVSAMELMPPGFVEDQLDAVFDDLNVTALKTGALGAAEIIETVAGYLADMEVPKVIDPVMISKHGDLLLPDEAQSAVAEELVPAADLITPNKHEAGALADVEVEDFDSADWAASEILDMGPKAVLVTSVPGQDKSVDLLVTEKFSKRIETPKAKVGFNHGSGCTLSSSCAANLARGMELKTAVQRAAEFTYRAMQAGEPVGRGINPLNQRAAAEIARRPETD